MGTFALSVTPTDDLIDVSHNTVVTGLAPDAQVGIVVQTRRSNGVLWHSRAAFVADVQDTVNLTCDASVSGNYTGVNVMGAIWSQRPEDDKAYEVFPLAVTGPLTTTLMTTANDESVHASFIQRLVAPGMTRHDTCALENEYGLVDTSYPPDPYAHPGPRSTVLILNGSGGGINEPRTALYASHSYAAFAPVYFKASGLLDYISNTSLEYSERALAWLRKHVEPLCDSVAVNGQSRGGELALLLGATFPETVSMTIGCVPGTAVYSGQNAADPAVGRGGPTWLYRGQPLLHLWEGNRTATWAPFNEGPTSYRHERAIRAALQDVNTVARTRIRIERARGSVLLFSATDNGS